AHFKLTEVKEKILPALDDEFAKVLGQFETLDAVRAEVRRQLESAKESESRQALEDKIVRALLVEAIGEKEEITVTDADVDAEVDKYARASQRPAPAVRRMMEKSGDLDALRHGMRERKTMDMLIEHARVSA